MMLCCMTAMRMEAYDVIKSFPDQYVIIQGVGNEIADKHKKQTKKLKEWDVEEGAIIKMFLDMRKWQESYNGYLKTVKGYAENIKAGSTIYHQGVMVLKNLYDIHTAIKKNPEGLAAGLAMSDIYLEVTAEFISTYRVMKKCIDTGGSKNMENGVDRTELLWICAEKLESLNEKLHNMALTIAFNNLLDVWDKYVAAAGVVRSHGYHAERAMERWKRASRGYDII